MPADSTSVIGDIPTGFPEFRLPSIDMSLMMTMVNVKAGGHTPISGALHAVVLLAIVLGAGTLASEIPKAVLAVILIKVGTDIIDWDYLKRLKVAPKAGVVILVTVLVVTVTIDLLLAVGIGMVMASFLFMKHMTDMQIAGMSTVTRPGEIPLSAGRYIFLVGARPEVCQVLKHQKVLRHIDAGNMYQQRLDALHHASNILNEAA